MRSSQSQILVVCMHGCLSTSRCKIGWCDNRNMTLLLLRGIHFNGKYYYAAVQRQRQPPIAIPIQKSNLTRLLYNLHAIMPCHHERWRKAVFHFQQIKVSLVIVIIFVCFNCSVHLFLLLPFLPPCHAELVFIVRQLWIGPMDRRPVIWSVEEGFLDKIFFSNAQHPQ